MIWELEFCNSLVPIGDRLPDNTYPTCSISKRDYSTYFELSSRGDLIACWDIRNFPSCKHIGIFRSMIVGEPYRKIGVASLLHGTMIRYCETVMQLKLLMCTVVFNNFPQQRVLLKHRWSQVGMFPDNGGDKMICLYVLPLRY